jgi:NADH:quinone reductase (non-electrogenic)
VWTAGQVIGLIHDIPTCSELVSRIEKEAEETLKDKLSLLVTEQPKPDISGKPIGDTTSDPRREGNNSVPAEAQLYDIGKAKL